MSERRNGGAPRPADERAEEIVDDLGRRVGQYAAVAGHYLRRAAALAREEAEDIWAEAQSLRAEGRRRGEGR